MFVFYYVVIIFILKWYVFVNDKIWVYKDERIVLNEIIIYF